MNERVNDATAAPEGSDGSAEFVLAARRLLDAGDAALDGAVVARLGAVRRAAVATMKAVPVRAFAQWIPAGAAACTFLAVGLLAWSLRAPTLPVYDDELARLAAQDLELLDDIEFVAWMVESGVADAT